MTTKEYLSQIELLDKKIKQKKSELHDLRLIATSTGGMNYDADRVQTSPSGDTMANKVIKCVDLEAQIDEQLQVYIHLKHKIIDEIQKLDDVRYVDLLFKRYVEFKMFEQISVEMGYEYQYTRELHALALNAFESTYTNLHDDGVI